VIIIDYSTSEPTSLCSFSLVVRVLCRRATNTNFIVFFLIRLELEPTIYRTRGEYDNHYTTNEPTIYCTRGDNGGVMVIILTSSTVDRRFIGGVMVIVLASSTVDRRFIGGVMVIILTPLHHQ
jgi:hypothetical protein